MNVSVSTIRELAAGVLAGRPLPAEAAVELLAVPDGSPAFQALLEAALAVRERFLGRRVFFCSIVNAKAGNCSEDCIYCTQSRISEVIDYSKHPWLDDQAVAEAAAGAAASGASALGLVAAWRGLQAGKRLDMVCASIARLAGSGLRPDASLGLLDSLDTARALKAAGLVMYHHNIETARSFFPNTRSTHSFNDRWRTVGHAKAAGMLVCCGGLFGLGESPEQRIEFAGHLRDLQPDTIPLNFLIPAPGTPVADRPLIPAGQALALLATFRLFLPDRHLLLAGGKEEVLGDRLGQAFRTGIDGVMVGNYLTRIGTPADFWQRVLAEEGLELVPPPGSQPG